MWWCLCVQVLGVEGEKNFRSQLELPNLSFCHNHKNSTLLVQSGKTFKLLVILFIYSFILRKKSSQEATTKEIQLPVKKKSYSQF